MQALQYLSLSWNGGFCFKFTNYKSINIIQWRGAAYLHHIEGTLGTLFPWKTFWLLHNKLCNRIMRRKVAYLHVPVTSQFLILYHTMFLVCVFNVRLKINIRISHWCCLGHRFYAYWYYVGVSVHLVEILGMLFLGCGFCFAL